MMNQILEFLRTIEHDLPPGRELFGFVSARFPTAT
jgi:hypothetical protein